MTAVLLLGCLLAAGVPPQSGAETVPVVARPLAVIDGDTLLVETPGGTAMVRLIGVDSPELGRPPVPPEFLALEARDFAQALVRREPVRLTREVGREDRDRYDRLLRYVYLPDGRLLNAELLRNGLGHALTRFPFARSEEFLRGEAEARQRQTGLWAEGGMAEIRWLRERGRPSIEVLPMTNGEWALQYRTYVKPRIGTRDLDEHVSRLGRWIRQHAGAELEQKLAEDGYRPVR